VNGQAQDTGPLAGWVIAIAHGQTLLGKRVPMRSLQPVYSLTCAMQFVQQNPRQPPQLMTARQVMPMLTFPSIQWVDVPADAILIEVESLSAKERRELAAGVEACDRLIQAMRAEESGLLLVPPGAKLREPSR
jgi:hypothetical protein